MHDAYDSDIDATVRAGDALSGGPVFALPGTSGAIASDWVDGTSVTGSQSWTFRVPIPFGAALCPVCRGRIAYYDPRARPRLPQLAGCNAVS